MEGLPSQWAEPGSTCWAGYVQGLASGLCWPLWSPLLVQCSEEVPGPLLQVRPVEDHSWVSGPRLLAPDLSSAPGGVRWCPRTLRARVRPASQLSLSPRPSWVLCCTESARRSCGGAECSSSSADSP